ncbi:MAG: hypothetical protein AAGG55_11025 [Pseudomonadota bacterium]
MTEAEQGLLFVEFLGAANTIFSVYMTLVFAMLTASWFLAERMSRAIVLLFLSLYTLAAFGLGTGVVGSFGDFFALQRYIAANNAIDGPLQWLGPVRAGVAPPKFSTDLFVGLVVALPWIGSIVFFSILRRERTRENAVRDGDTP